MAIETHAISQCCWCQQYLIRTEAIPFWTCATPACATRINSWNIAICDTDSKGKVKFTRGVPTVRQMVFLPTPRATVFFERQAQTKYTLFGGAKYVAKSFTLRWGAYRECMRIPNFRVLLLRRTFQQLEISHLLDMPAEAKQLELLGAQYKQGAREFCFANGSLIKAGHCETTADAANYLSSSWDLIIFDEIVTFEVETMFLPISTCARSTKPQVVAEGGGKVWAATNPGGRGAAWVPEFFIEKTPDRERYPEYHPDEWSYVPGVLEDNPYAPKGYRQTLMNLPPILRRQWLYSDWSAFEGQFFEFMAQHDGQPWHVRDLGLVA